MIDGDLIGFLFVQWLAWRYVLRETRRRRLANKLAYIEERRLERAPVDEAELADCDRSA